MEPRYDIINTSLCCGVRQLYGISNMTAEHIVYTVGRAVTDERHRAVGAFYTFSDNTFNSDNNTHYGDVLRDFIVEHNLGTVTETEPRRNSNSGNMLKFYTWTIDKPAVLAWVDARDGELVEGVLEGHDLAIGDFVRFSGQSPNHFPGRGVINSINTRYVVIRRKDTGRTWNILHEELPLLVKTRKFTVTNN